MAFSASQRRLLISIRFVDPVADIACILDAGAASLAVVSTTSVEVELDLIYTSVCRSSVLTVFKF